MGLNSQWDQIVIRNYLKTTFNMFNLFRFCFVFKLGGGGGVISFKGVENMFEFGGI